MGTTSQNITRFYYINFNLVNVNLVSAKNQKSKLENYNNEISNHIKW
jgi:hypothetical protein